MKYLELKLWKCQNSTNNNTIGVKAGVICKDQKTIDEMIGNQTFNFAFINTMFAQDNFEEPLQPFIDDQLFFEVDPKLSKKANFYIQSQTASLEDDLIQLGQSKDLEFHQVVNIKTSDNEYSDKEGYVIAIYIRADKFYDEYSRQVTDILTLLGDIGGLQEAFIMVGTLLIGFVTQKIFMSDIIKKIYHIRQYENIEREAAIKSNRYKYVGEDDAEKHKIHPGSS